ncbi:MAG: hypothetical protein ABSB80_09775 [Methanoregula sp.]|jgi:hypothetical protein|uniref:hypothetical protein n=1 Tax=Methanoregula sp. TaxID=2052170 RepID=UPI003D150C4E
MGRIQKRERGEHYPPGFIKLKIIEYVYNNVNGVKTPVLKEHLKIKYRVGETKGVLGHLKSLEEKHYIKGTHEPGLDTIWFPPDTLDHLPALLTDREVWGALRVDKKPVADVIDWLQDNCDSVVKLYNTQFFNKTVKPQLVQNLYSSPPLLDEFNAILGTDLKSVPRSETDERALRELYNRALSESPTVMYHMYIPSLLIRAGLYAIQINSKMYVQIAETALQDNQNQYPFVRHQLSEVRKQLQSWKDTDHVPGDMFKSIEAFGLASVYVGMSIDHIQLPHIGEKIDSILWDPATNVTLGKYLKNPFFSVEHMKFLIILAAVWGAFSAKK